MNNIFGQLYFNTGAGPFGVYLLQIKVEIVFGTTGVNLPANKEVLLACVNTSNASSKIFEQNESDAAVNESGADSPSTTGAIAKPARIQTRGTSVTTRTVLGYGVFSAQLS